MLLDDDFHGVNGTALAAHSPPEGGPWTDDTVGWQIESNQAVMNAADPVSHVPIGSRNFQAYFLVDTNSAGGAVYTRWTFENNAKDTLFSFQLWGDTTFQLVQSVGPENRTFENSVAAAALGQVRIDMFCTTSFLGVLLNNQPLVRLPRLFARNFVFDRMELLGHKPAGNSMLQIEAAVWEP